MDVTVTMRVDTWKDASLALWHASRSAIAAGDGRLARTLRAASDGIDDAVSEAIDVRGYAETCGYDEERELRARFPREL